VTLAGTAGLLGWHARPSAAEPPPETPKLRIFQSGGFCAVPLDIAKELLRAEGFTEVEYIKIESGLPSSTALSHRQADIGLNFAGPLIVSLDAGNEIVVLGGVHVGCFEVVTTDRVRTVRDLKGKTLAITAPGSTPHLFISSMVAYVGVDPRTDIHWVTHPLAEQIRLLTEEKIDGLGATPPTAQELRAKKIGHVVVNSAVDRPWSQYFCCLVEGNREFVRKHPAAAKRALRAILKATDLCAADPERVARFSVDEGHTKNYAYALQALQELPYNKWREFDPEDTIRFHALRLHEAGMIKSSPQKLIAQGTDWRFLKELKKEMKG
jgi:NitT/TauT family transport system substrate-binding protein